MNIRATLRHKPSKSVGTLGSFCFVMSFVALWTCESESLRCFLRVY